MTLLADGFLNLRTPKNVISKCVKSPVSEDPSTRKMVSGTKYYSKLNDSPFTKFTDPCEDNLGWKSLSQWYPKSLGCLLTHWLRMTSIVFLKEGIYCNIFRWNYLIKENIFIIFFFFWCSKFRFNFQLFQKKDEPHNSWIFELTDCKKRG